MLDLQPQPKRKTSAKRLRYSKTRRAKLAAAQLCINGAHHGAATHGVRCEQCSLVHRGEIDRAEVAHPPIAVRTHCRRGHERTPENQVVFPSSPYPRCKPCIKISNAEYTVFVGES